MSNVKITQLPLATTPLTGTEVFPLVQGTTTKQVSVANLFTDPVMVNPTLGTVGQADLINATGLPISTGVSGLGSGIATFLGTPSSANLRAAVTDETGTGALVFATSPTLVTPNLGTPSAMVATNITGTALGLIAGSAVTNANLTGAVTSVGNATSLGSFTSAQLRTALTDETGSGVAVFATSPTLVTPDLGTPSAGVLTNATGLPLTTGVTGTLGLGNGGTGQTTANAAFNALAPSQTGNSGKYLTTDGTNTSWGTNPLGTVTSVDVSGGTTGLTTSGGPVTTSGTITLAGTLATTNGGTGLTSFTANGVLYASSTSALTSGSALTFDGTRLSIGSGNSTAAGLTAGYFGASGYGAIWSTSVTPLTTNFAFLTNGTSTVLNGSSNVTFQVNNADSMALTSTGLGIGTSSPAARLSVVTASANSTAATIGGIEYGGSKRGLTIKTYQSAGGDDCGVEFNAANGLAGYGAFKFAANTTTLATLDSAGNLGLGVTPSAWYSTARALQMGTTGSVFGRTGNELVGLSSNAYNSGSASTTYAYVVGGNYATNYLQTTGQHQWFNAPSGTAGNAISFTQAMTLDASGNLGVGTTSPSVRVHAMSSSSSLSFGLSPSSSNTNIGYITNDSTYIMFASGYGTTGQKFRVALQAPDNSATIDSSGNLGLGVTPSAWNSGYKAFQINQSAAWSSGADIGISANAYIDSAGTNRYIDSYAYGSKYYQYNGQHQWHVTTSTQGAGNAISFTQAMTLDASGNLLLNETSQAYSSKFTLSYDPTANNGPIVLDNRSYAINRGGITWYGGKYNTAGNYRPYGGIGAKKENATDGNSAGYLVFYTNDNSADATERARIDSSGNLLVGTTSNPITARAAIDSGSNANTLWINSSNGTYGVSATWSYASNSIGQIGSSGSITGGSALNTFGINGVNAITLHTNYTEAARIDSSGNLLVGKTSVGASNVGFQLNNVGEITVSNTATTNAGATQLNVYSTGASAYRFFVGMGGTIYATSTTITAISDQRLKENIQDIDVGLDSIMALKPRKFDWKAGKGKDKKGDRGWIAQEFEQVFPDMIDTWKDPAPEGEEPYKAVNADLIPVLVKAIQEQQAIIESLKARLDAANL